MKSTAPEQFRLTHEQAARRGFPKYLGSDESYGLNGMFFVPFRSVVLRVVSSDGACVEDETGQWEHVSVSLPNRCPTWEEMCFIKDLFFERNEACIQYHPREADYVNHHPYCLHIWRPKSAPLPVPPPILVGPRGAPAPR